MQKVSLNEAVKHLQLGGGPVFVYVMGTRVGLLQVGDLEPWVKLFKVFGGVACKTTDEFFIEDELRADFSPVMLELLNRSNTLMFQLLDGVIHVYRDQIKIGELTPKNLYIPELKNAEQVFIYQVSAMLAQQENG